jgi:hypothetical protein
MRFAVFLLSRPKFRYSLQSLLVLVLLWSAALGTWSYFSQAHRSGEPVLLVRDRYVGVIFPGGSSFDTGPTAWEPSVQDVERAEQRVPEFMESRNPHLAARLGEYVRQYFGIVQSGRRVIFCNFLYRTSITDGCPTGRGDCYMRSIGTPAIVVDGGEHFFQLRYDPKTDHCSGLHVNYGRPLP